MKCRLIACIIRTTRERQCLVHDDRLDSVAGGFNYFLQSMAMDQRKAAKEQKAGEIEQLVQGSLTLSTVVLTCSVGAPYGWTWGTRSWTGSTSGRCLSNTEWGRPVERESLSTLSVSQVVSTSLGGVWGIRFSGHHSIPTSAHIETLIVSLSGGSPQEGPKRVHPTPAPEQRIRSRR